MTYILSPIKYINSNDKSRSGSYVRTRTYYIYLIDEDVAKYYHGRERMFHDLFHQYVHVSGKMRKIISRQIHYITNPIPMLTLYQIIKNTFSNQWDYVNQTGSYQLSIKNDRDFIEVTIEKQYVRLDVYGSLDAESIFFEGIRAFNGYLFAIDFDNHKFGWIRPIKERKYV
ncbi:sporulation inhibitor of replication protein SirA [Bacillus ginsengihumi]|uniref:Sporulation inhibitor of replication protein SirA n=1 Tax=Heyndrickxia ginsengihumi TaxID=363870 RepID=A0A6M0P7B7_9BACI|nr:sporulation inhibitor of replication protein SirA [Heyndrickxia ginsengihumi]NEY20586.1 sporulation inhibitor of replication protein SirA [Heyndrickxia ginsengihumi]